MKVTVYEKMSGLEPDKKSKVIGEFEVKEPGYLKLKELQDLEKKRFSYDYSVDVEAKKLILKDAKINQDAFVPFYEKVLEFAGLTEEDIVKYGFKYADTALEQIYLAWTTSEKKS